MKTKYDAVTGGLDIALLYCQHTIRDDADINGAAKGEMAYRIRPAMMPCSSKVQLSYLLKILDEAYDGVEVVACASESCRFLVGSAKAVKRVNRGRALLDRIGVGADRLGITFGSGLSGEALVDIALKRGEAVRAIVEGGAKK
jgi:coenzyme F420-reducing hydrogenase delta subunit